MRFLSLTLTSLALVALPLAACGKDSGSAASSSGASLAPASTVVYVEAELEHDGQVDELLAKFPGGADAGAKLADLIEKGLREDDAPISYKQDVQPWLGDQVAFFVNGRFTADGDVQDAAALVATDDEEAAIATVEKAAEGKAESATYKDHDYLTLSTGGDARAAGVVDGWLVVGTPSGYKAAVDASEGEGLADSDKYERALADADEERIGLAYVDSKAFYDAARARPGGEALGSFADVFEQPYVVTLDADADGVELAASLSGGAFAEAMPFFGEGTELVGDAPADAWLVLGQPDLGETIDALVKVAAKQAGGRAALERQLSLATGGMTLADLTGWMGDFALFVSGESVADLSGALVIETTDPAASERVLRKLRGLAPALGDRAEVRPLGVDGEGFTLTGPGLPRPIHVFQRDGKVVVAYGDAAAEAPFGASDRLADSEEFKSASAALGDGYAVSTWVAIEPILALVESTPAAGDAEWAQVRSYLEPLGAIVSGAKADGDEISSAVRVTVP